MQDSPDSEGQCAENGKLEGPPNGIADDDPAKSATDTATFRQPSEQQAVEGKAGKQPQPIERAQTKWESQNEGNNPERRRRSEDLKREIEDLDLEIGELQKNLLRAIQSKKDKQH